VDDEPAACRTCCNVCRKDVVDGPFGWRRTICSCVRLRNTCRTDGRTLVKFIAAGKIAVGCWLAVAATARETGNGVPSLAAASKGSRNVVVVP
jgi:hypothetical protein